VCRLFVGVKLLKSGLIGILLLLICGYASQWGEYTTMVCMSNIDGSTVQVWGIDTLVTVDDVTKVLYSGRGYEVITMKGDTLIFPRPLFRRMNIITPTPDDGGRIDSVKAGRPKRPRKSRKAKKTESKTEKWPGTE